MTLGYEYIMSDIKQLSKDFNLFRRKLKRRNKDFEYISVAEYKGNESLHLHILIKSHSNKRLFFDRNLIIKLWGQRDVYIERIHNSMDIERIAKYLNPFTNPKKFKRLNYYKRNFRIYNCSNGIIQPKITQLSFREAMTYMNQNGYIKNNSKSYNIVANIDNYNDIILNSVTKIYLQKRKGEISQRIFQLMMKTDILLRVRLFYIILTYNNHILIRKIYHHDIVSRLLSLKMVLKTSIPLWN